MMVRIRVTEYRRVVDEPLPGEIEVSDEALQKRGWSPPRARDIRRYTAGSYLIESAKDSAIPIMMQQVDCRVVTYLELASAIRLHAALGEAIAHASAGQKTEATA